MQRRRYLSSLLLSSFYECSRRKTFKIIEKASLYNNDQMLKLSRTCQVIDALGSLKMSCSCALIVKNNYRSTKSD